MLENELMTRASAIAYYAMLAVVPFLALVITVSVQYMPQLGKAKTGDGTYQDITAISELHATIATVFPDEITSVVTDQIERIQDQPATGILSITFVILLWLASSLFLAVIDAMDRIYGVKETRPFWKLRLTAILMTSVQAVILLGSLISIAVWPTIIEWLRIGATGAFMVTLAQWVVIVLMVLFSFAVTFYVAPNIKHNWEWITPGSVLGTAVFLLATFGFGIYVRNFARYNETYGSLGGVMALLLWFWISALVVLLAAQINAVIETAAPAGRDFKNAR